MDASARPSRQERLKTVSLIEQESVRAYADKAVERAIFLALKGIRYGSVEIIIHDFRVVQIERKEKTRFDGAPSQSAR